jgi:hypothetical protein
VLLQLLFSAASWHALAKLRLHTDHTLNLLDDATSSLGSKLRNFSATVCTEYNTRELQREADARQRRQATAQKPPNSGASTAPVPGPSALPSAQKPVGGRRPKALNLNTYKNHSLGDYAATIRMYGTTDSYSTEAVRYSMFWMSMPMTRVRA